MKKWLTALVLPFLLVNVLAFPTKADEGRTIWVGDSRFVGMSQSVKTNSNDIFIAKGGMGYPWFVSTAIPQVNSTLKSGDKIVLNMGVNGFGADNYINTVNNLVKNEWKDCKVYYMSINPVVDNLTTQNGMIASDQQVIDFNNQLKEKLDKSITYIDTYSTVKKDIAAKTMDGVHYTKQGYQEIYDLAQKALTGQTLNEQNETKKSKSCKKKGSKSHTIPWNFDDIDWDSKYYTFNKDGVNGHPNVCDAANNVAWPYATCESNSHKPGGGWNKMICASYAYSRYWDVNYHDSNYPLMPGTIDSALHHGSSYPGVEISTSQKDVKSGSVVGLGWGSGGHDIFIEEVRDNSIVISEANISSGESTYGWRCKEWGSLDEYMASMGMYFRATLLPNEAINIDSGSSSSSHNFKSKLDSINAPSVEELKSIAKSKHNMSENDFILAYGWLAGWETSGIGPDGADAYADYLSACVGINHIKKYGYAKAQAIFNGWGSYYNYHSLLTHIQQNGNNEYLRKLFYIALTDLDSRAIGASGFDCYGGKEIYSTPYVKTSPNYGLTFKICG